MTSNRGLWIRELSVSPDRRVDPVCRRPFLDASRAEVGDDAVAWAVRLAYDVAVQVVANFSEFGSGPAQFETMRLATESATLIAMLAIYAGDRETPEMTDDGIRAIHDWVHRGITLPVIWASMRRGHSWLAENYMRACVEFVPIAEQPDQLRLTSEVLFSLVDRFSAAVGREYGIEHERWIMSTAAARDELVQRILAGQSSDTVAAENTLRYKLSHRHHIGLIIWTDSLDAAVGSSLHKDAVALLHDMGAESTLLVARGAQGLDAWGNSTKPLHTLDATNITLRPGARAVVGASHPGQDGFVRTHHEAQATRTVTETMPGIRHPVVAFRSVHLLTLLGRDMTRAKDFVDTELGDLAGDDPQLAELRRTTEAYLRLKRSPLAVAQELFVVRNTVAYRLKKVEELLGHSLDERTLETWVALQLKDGMSAAD